MRLRIKAVNNISKITKSMKMISAAKLNSYQATLEAARPFTTGFAHVFERPELSEDDAAAAAAAAAPVEGAEEKKNPHHMMVLVSSDRGLCGAIHSSVGKVAKREGEVMDDAGTTYELALIGDKVRAVLNRSHSNHFGVVATEVGRKRPATFSEAATVATAVLDKEFTDMSIVFNKFKSVIEYNTTSHKFPNLDDVMNSAAYASKFDQYEFEGEKSELLADLYQFNAACLLLDGLLENGTSEVSSRMTAMDNATNNANDMVNKLSITYNRARQAVITTELSEIISGAIAVE